MIRNPPPTDITGLTGVVELPTLNVPFLSISFIGTNFGSGIELGWIDSTENFQPLTAVSVLTGTCTTNVQSGHSRRLAVRITGTAQDGRIEMYINQF